MTLVLLCVFGAWAKPKAAAVDKNSDNTPALPTGPLRVDSVKIHGLYLDGEFDQAIALLEANLKETRQYRHDDSVFIFKHLGVMYAAQYDTREKGKYFMHRLVLVEPTAKIMDMYASDMIYMIFRNIQDEYEQTRMAIRSRRQQPDMQDSLSKPSATQALNTTGSSGGKKWIWAGVAGAALATGMGAYFILNDQQPTVVHKDYKF